MTEPDEIPTEVRAFLYSCIDTVEQVEILSLLVQSGRAWTVKTAATELGLPDHLVRTHVEMLASRGLAKITTGREVSYEYAPKSPDLRRYAELLCEHYSRSRMTILRYIASSPRRAVKGFADAFILRETDE